MELRPAGEGFWLLRWNTRSDDLSCPGVVGTELFVIPRFLTSGTCRCGVVLQNPSPCRARSSREMTGARWTA